MKNEMKELVEFLDKKYDEENNNGKTSYDLLIGNFDGGNDSGGSEFSIEMPDWIEEILYKEVEDLLSYGSWAGNFYASGSIYYNKETKELSVVGEEIDDENQINLCKETIDLLEIEIIAEYIDSVNIYSSYYEDSNFRININNGVWTEEIQNIETLILNRIVQAVNNYNEDEHRWHIDDNYTIDELEKKNWQIDIDIDIPHRINIDKSTILYEEEEIELEKTI